MNLFSTGRRQRVKIHYIQRIPQIKKKIEKLRKGMTKPTSEELQCSVNLKRYP